MFDHYLFVDWSAASVPTGRRPRRDAIWVGYGSRRAEEIETRYYPTRHAAFQFIQAFLRERVRARERTLCGLDIGYGYPAGLTELLGFPGRTAWQQLWAFLHQRIEDDDRNRNNRYAVAEALNQRLGNRQAPFWGHAPGKHFEHLRPTRRHFSFPLAFDAVRLNEYRIVDRRLRGLQSAWKLHYPASVGSQILMGIPYLYRLRFLDPELRDHSLVWPQETGFTTTPLSAASAYILHAEIWPGLLKIPPTTDGTIRDQLQVRGMVAWARDLARTGALDRQFATPSDLSSAELAIVSSEEGWILGVP